MSSPAGLFASITGVAERPAVGDSILPQWVVCPSSTFAATRSVSAAAACSANPTTFTSSPRRSSRSSFGRRMLAVTNSHRRSHGLSPFRPVWRRRIRDGLRSSRRSALGRRRPSRPARRTPAPPTPRRLAAVRAVVREAAAPRPAAGDAGDVFLARLGEAAAVEEVGSSSPWWRPRGGRPRWCRRR